MSDIVNRLHDWAGPADKETPGAPFAEVAALMREAAEEIVRLQGMIVMEREACAVLAERMETSSGSLIARMIRHRSD